ncbi:MAG TPA: sugar ABC transporter permease [Chloroflexota bacterium]|nr:sugar ABC transporter permease [Chloroflexota bacterium]
MATLGTTARRMPLAVPAGGPRLGRDWRLGYALTLPVVLVIVGLIAFPLGYSVWLSLQDIKLGGQGTFVGAGNYSKILLDSTSRIHDQFWNSVYVTAVYVGGALCGKFILGMTTALILHAQIKARNLWRALLFLPWSIPAIVSSYSWKWIYNDVNGIFNNLLMGYGLIERPILFLADPTLAVWSVLLAVIWQGTPFWTMTFLAGLQAIPHELYEAAEIDGASTAKSFWHITLPNLTSVILVTVMLSAIFTTNSIQYIYILTNGGPGGATETFPLLAISQGLRAYDLGIAAAIPLLFFPMFALFIYVLTKRMLRTES